MSEHTLDEWEGDVVEDVTVYDGEPDFDAPTENDNGDQDDEIPFGGLGFFARSSSGPRNREETLEWYRTHQTAAQIGFDPDNMCLKVVRTARNIGPKHLTAKASQDATPLNHRHGQVRELRPSMPVYFDDPNDSNRAGHVVTMIGRVPGFDPDSLHDILVETNTVKANELVVVRGSYFQEHWGDEFKFGSTWLNDVILDIKPAPRFDSKIEKFNSGGPIYKLNLLVRAGEDRPAAKRVYDGIMRQVNGLPDSPKLVRIREFKDKVRSGEKLLDMDLLNAAVKHRGPGPGRIRTARDEIRRLINSLPDE